MRKDGPNFVVVSNPSFRSRLSHTPSSFDDGAALQLTPTLSSLPWRIPVRTSLQRFFRDAVTREEDGHSIAEPVFMKLMAPISAVSQPKKPVVSLNERVAVFGCLTNIG